MPTPPSFEPRYGAALSIQRDELPPAGVSLAAVLDLERVDRDLFRSTEAFSERYSLFGGQVAAQALVAAGRTVAQDRPPHSLHGYFLRPGDSRQPVVFTVERDRDGRSFSARRVVARQDGQVILNLSASFAVPDQDAPQDTKGQRPDVGPPEHPHVPPRLIGFEQAVPRQPHPLHSYPTVIWQRCIEPLPADPLTSAAVITYLSDLYTGNGALASSAGVRQATLDHAVWFHHLTPAGAWVLMDLAAGSVGGGRGLYSGRLWAADGTLLASLAQETLYRRPGAIPSADRTGSGEPI